MKLARRNLGDPPSGNTPSFMARCSQGFAVRDFRCRAVVEVGRRRPRQMRTIVDSSSEASAAVTARHSLLCEPVPAGSDNLQDCFRQLPLRANAGFAAELDEAALYDADAASSRQHRRALAVMSPQAKPYLRMVLPQPNQGTCLPDRPGSSERAVIVPNPVSPFP